MKKSNAQSIYKDLSGVIQDPRCELNYKNMYELIIAVILSAQCTDKRVNMVTVDLFKKYPTAYDLAHADQNDVIDIIRSLGFFNTKSKNIISCAKDIVNRFGGQVPSNMEELVTLSGVGRKTASVVMAEGYKKPAVAVDTHVNRVANRIGLSTSQNVKNTEESLKALFDSSEWARLHSTLLLYGRYYCTARNPKCDTCVIKDRCKYFNNRKR